MDKISVIVPVYNVEKYIIRCIDSILLQTYNNLEVILINDGSTDSSGDICERYKKEDDRIKVIHKNNGGQSSARNEGLGIATGDYIGFVDSDDWLVKDIYEHCINIIKNYKCDLVDFRFVFSYGKKKLFYSTNNKLELVEGKDILRDYLLRAHKDKAPFSVWRKLYKIDLFKNIRFPAGKIHEDIVTNYKILMNTQRLVHTNKIGYYYFQNYGGTTLNGLKKRDFDLLDASKELISLTQNVNYRDIKYLAKVKLARSYFSLLAKIAHYGINDHKLNYREVVRELTKNLRKNYFLLMKSPITFNRKILISILCINIKLLSTPIGIYKNIRGFHDNT